MRSPFSGSFFVEVYMLRNMTCLFILDGEKMLLLYRIGSRVGPDSWRGIGGHFEKDELNDPDACVLRELREEIGLMPWDIKNLRLRYISLSDHSGEIRQNYFYFADLIPGTHSPAESPEGKLEWVEFKDIWRRFMPRSTKSAVMHYLKKGRYDEKIYCGFASGGKVEFKPMDDIK